MIVVMNVVTSKLRSAVWTVLSLKYDILITDILLYEEFNQLYLISIPT